MQNIFFFKPGPGERVETQVTLNADQRSALYGHVVDSEGRPVEGALVMLLETGERADVQRFSSCQFTDGEGCFMFGPLQPGLLYAVRIYKNSVKIRQFEIVTEG